MEAMNPPHTRVDILSHPAFDTAYGRCLLLCLTPSTEEDIEPMRDLDATTRTEIEAAAFRRLLDHLDDHKEVQNIDLMNLADFCRNCLSKWLVDAAEERGTELDHETARDYVYGMPYAEWKANYQQDATPAQLAAMQARQARKQSEGNNGEQ